MRMLVGGKRRAMRPEDGIHSTPMKRWALLPWLMKCRLPHRFENVALLVCMRAMASWMEADNGRRKCKALKVAFGAFVFAGVSTFQLSRAIAWHPYIAVRIGNIEEGKPVRSRRSGRALFLSGLASRFSARFFWTYAMRR